MIKFLLKGILRDHHRSLFPVMIVSIGVALTVVLQSWVTGVFGDLTEFSAKFNTGHVRVMTKGYAENIDQIPNDYALTDLDNIINNLNKDFPDVTWEKRIKFGGLIDIPDENGETKIQGPAVGLAIDMLSKNSAELDRLKIRKSLKEGKLPTKPGEILLSNQFANKLNIQSGDIVTIISSTMYGSMAINNFIMSGTVEFGSAAMDNGAVIIDIADAQNMLDMDDATSELLGYFTHNYNQIKATKIVNKYNATLKSDDEFSPIMQSIADDRFLGSYIEYAESFSGIMIFIFLLIMSVVLWNSGLLGALRRYGEVGVRLAIGEAKGHIYLSMIVESIMIGIIGSIVGTIIGLCFASLLVKGIDIGAIMKNTTMMMPSVFRAQITVETFYIGFIPGIFSTVLGTILSGIGIYKRQTAELFKELEA